MFLSQAGNGKMLSDSASYPLEFGFAIAALIGPRGTRSEDTHVDLNAYIGCDDGGALEDFTKGPKKAWWKQLYQAQQVYGRK